MTDDRKRRGTGMPWDRISTIFAVTSLGVSQIFFNLVANNFGWFIGDELFLFWLMLWTLILPFALLFCLDLLVLRLSPNPAIYRFWRALLYSLLCISILRQFQVLHDKVFDQMFGFLEPRLVYALFAVIVVSVSLKSRLWIPGYMRYLGGVGLILTGVFLYRTEGMIQIWSTPPPQENSVGTSEAAIPVFIILFDELSIDLLTENRESGKINSNSFPNFAALADGALWFTNATTNHWTTDDSLVSAVTGKLKPPASAKTLFEYFPKTYRTDLIVSEVWVEQWFRSGKNNRGVGNYKGKAYFLSHKPLYSLKYLLLSLIDSEFFTTNRIKKQIFSTRAFHLTFREEMDSFLETIDSRSTGVFIWHASVPHFPFMFSADGTSRRVAKDFFPQPGSYNPADYQAILMNYREQIKFTDGVLGTIVHRLRQRNLYNRSLIVVTSDHGLRIWGDMYGHFDLLARVPVIIRAPSLQPGISNVDFQLIDLLPTILDILQVPYDSSNFDGVSALKQPRPLREKIVDFNGTAVAFHESTNSWKDSPRKSDLSLNLSNKNEDYKDLVIQSATGNELEYHFSAVLAMEDLYYALEEKQDFLTIYLSKHFPKNAGKADLKLLLSRLEALENSKPSVPNRFKKGMNYFFLALLETWLISKGGNEELNLVNRHWTAALKNLQKAGDLDPRMGEEIRNIIAQADSDGNHTLDRRELSRIITSRQH